MLWKSRLYSFDDQLSNERGAVGRMRMGKQNQTTQKTCPRATLSTTDCTFPDLGSDPGQHVGKPVTTRAVAHPPWLRFACRKCQILAFILANLIMSVVIVFTALCGSGRTACCRGETEGSSRTCESSTRCSKSLDQRGFFWQPDSWPEHNCHGAQERKQPATGSFKDPPSKCHFSQGMYQYTRNVTFHDNSLQDCNVM